MRPILFVGAGRFAREVIPLVRESGRQITGILDDRCAELPTLLAGVPILGDLSEIGCYRDTDVVVTIASGIDKAEVVARLAALGTDPERYVSVIDPTVRNPAGCPIGRGSILLAGVTITADAELGTHVVAMPHVTVTHDCLVADFVTFASGVSLGGGVSIGTSAYLGMNASVRQEVKVGARAVLGMGAVALRDIPEGETWAGVPAKRLELRG
jgi:sugar O-acyltransferase (sialic acid O-acetyltransferase NeuD family)